MSSRRTRCPPICTGRPASSPTARVPSSPIRTVPALSPVRLPPCRRSFASLLTPVPKPIVPCPCDCTDGASLGPTDIGPVRQAEAGERHIPALDLGPVEDHAGCGRVVAVDPVCAERGQPGHHLLGRYQPA